MYDTGFKVLSMKINYLAPFKHKHKVAYFRGTLHDSYSMQGRKVRYQIFMAHATKECEVANLHGQATDTYAYV
jgi:hypothetical protein